MGKPTIQEIAAMPFPKSLQAVREYYDPSWGKNDEEGEPIKAFRVRFDWTLRGRFDDVIEANTEAEALEKAMEWVHDHTYSADVETAREVITPAKASEQ
jgi:hypothetical protein